MRRIIVNWAIAMIIAIGVVRTIEWIGQPRYEEEINVLSDNYGSNDFHIESFQRADSTYMHFYRIGTTELNALSITTGTIDYNGEFKRRTK